MSLGSSCRVLALLLATSLWVAPQAQASLRGSVYGMGLLTRLSLGLGIEGVSTSTYEHGYQPSFGAGAGLDLRLGDSLSLELGAFAYQRKYSTAAISLSGEPGTDSIAFSLRTLTVPLIVHYWARKDLALGIGPYLTRMLGDADLDNGNRTRSLDYLGMKATDFGVMGSVTYAIQASAAAVLISARYAYGLANLSTDSARARQCYSTQFTETQLLLGLRLGGS